jgi:hypothetical protein
VSIILFIVFLEYDLFLSLYPSVPKTYGAARIKRSPHLSVLCILFCCFPCKFSICQHLFCCSSPCFFWLTCVSLSLRCPSKSCCRQRIFQHPQNMANPSPASLFYIYYVGIIPVSLSRSSFLIVFGQNILLIFLRHLV